MALEIQFIEVSRSFRRRRIGTQVISHLAESHPDRRPVAFSEQADEFWSSLGRHR
jgi:ribosomal protein S18 acetylase RimI-like enzyme